MNLLLLFPLLALLGISGCAHYGEKGVQPAVQESIHTTDEPPPESTKAPETGPVTGLDELAKTYGIEIVTLHVTANGQMLDLRYRVIDPILAAVVTQRNSKVEIRIVDVKTGHVLIVPVTHLGMLRTRTHKPRKNRIYYVLFENQGGLVKVGSEVSIQFGDVKVNGWWLQ